jgi:hypothetical protein
VLSKGSDIGNARQGKANKMGAETYGIASVDALDNLQGLGVKSRASADPAAVTDFMSRTGYSLKVALADLIDNSIDAGAKEIEYGTLSVNGIIKYVYISDNGSGIDSISDALSIRHNPDNQHSRRLGRYGVGLKAASFSLGRSLILATRSLEDEQAACIEIEDYQKEYSYRTLSASHSEKLFPLIMDSPRHTGTAVIIGRIESIVPGSDQSQSALVDQLRLCESYIAMVFHRYLEKKRIRIFVASRESTVTFPYLHARRELTPISPFGYSASGNSSYPLDIVLTTEGLQVPIRCHIWPKQGSGRAEREANFDLGGGSVKWQGLYFYRHDRLVQCGGWAGLASIEPHMSLARVEVDLPPRSDSLFRPTITKDSIQNTSVITEALQARPEFTRYRSAAQKVYRTKIEKTLVTPPVPEQKPQSLPVIEAFRGRIIISEHGRKVLSISQQDAALQLARGFLANRSRTSLVNNAAEVDLLVRRLLKMNTDV